MSDPTIAVQLAVMERLGASVTQVAGRVFDTVPEDASLDYITVSVPSAIPIDEMCWDRSEISLQIDVWSSDPDSGVVKAIAASARAALHERDDLFAPDFVIDRVVVDGIFYSREEKTLLNRARMALVIEAQPS